MLVRRNAVSTRSRDPVITNRAAGPTSAAPTIMARPARSCGGCCDAPGGRYYRVTRTAGLQCTTARRRDRPDDEAVGERQLPGGRGRRTDRGGDRAWETGRRSTKQRGAMDQGEERRRDAGRTRR